MWILAWGNVHILFKKRFWDVNGNLLGLICGCDVGLPGVWSGFKPYKWKGVCAFILFMTDGHFWMPRYVYFLFGLFVSLLLFKCKKIDINVYMLYCVTGYTTYNELLSKTAKQIELYPRPVCPPRMPGLIGITGNNSFMF